MKDFHTYWTQMIKNAEENKEKLRLIPYDQREKIELLPSINEDLIPLESVEDTFKIGDVSIKGFATCALHNKRWGSKWGMYNLKTEYEGEMYYFETAWSPSEPLYLALAKKFPKLKLVITYFESGMMFHGQYVYEQGELKSHEQAKYFGRRGG